MRSITYGSVCSGIEAASVAWEPLGWKPLWFSEIESFPSAVLQHHWPAVPNLGDFTKIRDRIEAGEIEAPDVLVGGTPCQAFSVAGLRKSLDDSRGQLSLEFVRLADAIDHVRSVRGRDPGTIVWENVPGVLSTPDNAFGCFLGALAGENDALVPPGGKWGNAGYVRGPTRAVAWRILDAQYFGVAQRRRRVFVVASAGTVCPEQVLFEFDGVRRDSPPRREAGQGFAPVAGTLAANGGGTTRPAGNANELDFCVPVNGSHWDGGPHPSLNQSNNIGGVGMSNQELFSQRGAYLVDPCVMAHGQGGSEIRAGQRPTLTCNHEAPIGFLPVCATGYIAHTLRAEGFDASEDGTGRGAVAVAVVFQSSQSGVREVAPTITRNYGKQPDSSDTNAGPMVLPVGDQVRRLTPTECERLQGFPDGHTMIPWRGKPAAECPDGPRYKALGNSMAVPVMRWIGARIDRFLFSTPSN